MFLNFRLFIFQSNSGTKAREDLAAATSAVQVFSLSFLSFLLYGRSFSCGR